jgi:uncharacterized membrane protein
MLQLRQLQIAAKGVILRGMLRSLWVGVLIALPSGAGVALSILGGNAGSLVGVAISASLLPPAVNAVSASHRFILPFLCDMILGFSGNAVGVCSCNSHPSS